MVKIYYSNFFSSKFNLLGRSLVLAFSLLMLGSSFHANAAKPTSAAEPLVAEGTYMVLRNMDNFPANDHLVFSFIQEPWRRTDPETPYNDNHDRVTLRIYSRGYENLTINSLVLSNPTVWKIVSVGGDTSPTYPITVTPGNFREVIVQFAATKENVTVNRVELLTSNLTIASNDNLTPTKVVTLTGICQEMGEGRNEPYAQQIIRAFGFLSDPGYTDNDNGNMGTSVMPNSDEVNASFFVRADESKPVMVRQLGAYHGCCASTEDFRYYPKGSSAPADVQTLFQHNRLDGQSLLPRRINSATIAAGGEFTPSGAFGILVDRSYSDRTRNFQGRLGLRVLKVIDSRGNVVPNAYLVNTDYLNTDFTNYDYQDNVYYIENIKPESGTVNFSTLASTVGSSVTFPAALINSNNSRNVTIQNTGNTYSDNTRDPDILVKSVRILGPNAADFSVNSLETTLAPQATATLSVRYNPKTTGIKNAVMVVYYNNAVSPLRIPLYAEANDGISVVESAKRIKGGSNSPVTINGVDYESDASYRSGSVLNDAQQIRSDVAGTDSDELYQTYLSAAANGEETNYNIPLENGDYMVRMHFVENFFEAEGNRIFNINIEGQRVLGNFDIFNEVGYRAALVKDFRVTVSGGILNINFDPSANRVALAATEIFFMNTNPMPVTLIDFKAAKEGQTAILNWSTADETNSRQFDVERSANGKSWEIVGTVAAQGESSVSKAYSFADIAPAGGDNLYRLKMVDQDDSFAYSKILNLNFTMDASASIYPNPVAEKLVFKVNDWNKIGGVKLFNVNGKMVYQSAHAPVSGVDVRNLATGMYVVHLVRTDGTILTYKMLKN